MSFGKARKKFTAAARAKNHKTSNAEIAAVKAAATATAAALTAGVTDKIYPVKAEIRLPDGKYLPAEEFAKQCADGKLVPETWVLGRAPGGSDHGILFPYMGIEILKPKFTDQDGKALATAVDVAKKYADNKITAQDKTALQQAIKSSGYLRYNLVNMLLHAFAPTERALGELCVAQAPLLTSCTLQLAKVMDGKQLQVGLEFLQLAIALGADYKHFLMRDTPGRVSQLTREMLHKYIEFFKLTSLSGDFFGRPFIPGLMMGSYDEQYVLAVIARAVRMGCNINEQHPQYGDLLKQIAANEMCDKVISLSRELNATAAMKNMPPEAARCFKVDYKSKDGEGKTLLLIATLVRSEVLIEHLLKIHNPPTVDVGINEADNFGRTPLLVAAALCPESIVKLLLKAGAKTDAKDEKKRDLDVYRSASPELVTELLRSIHVEPDRDLRAPHNWLNFNDPASTPLAYSGSPHPKQLVLISNRDPHAGVIRNLLHDCKDDGLKKKIRQQTKDLCGTTVLEDCTKPARRIAIGREIRVHKEQKQIVTKRLKKPTSASAAATASAAAASITEDEKRLVALCTKHEWLSTPMRSENLIFLLPAVFSPRFDKTLNEEIKFSGMDTDLRTMAHSAICNAIGLAWTPVRDKVSGEEVSCNLVNTKYFAQQSELLNYAYRVFLFGYAASPSIGPPLPVNNQTSLMPAAPKAVMSSSLKICQVQ